MSVSTRFRAAAAHPWALRLEIPKALFVTAQVRSSTTGTPAWLGSDKGVWAATQQQLGQQGSGAALWSSKLPVCCAGVATACLCCGIWWSGWRWALQLSTQPWRAADDRQAQGTVQSV